VPATTIEWSATLAVHVAQQSCNRERNPKFNPKQCEGAHFVASLIRPRNMAVPFRAGDGKPAATAWEKKDVNCKAPSLPARIGVALLAILDLIGGEREEERTCFPYPHFVDVVSR